MKGLLLAGGHGTRLRPLTFRGNKHMLPIANRPLLFYGLDHLKEAGVREVAIILGPIKEGIEDQIGDGADFGLHVTYITQGEPKGLAHAVLCAREFLGEEDFLMYLGDNLLEHGAAPYLERFAQGDASAVVGAVPVKEPRHYGVVEMAPDGNILSIEEKPASPKSNLALIGVYLFTPEIHRIIAELKPSKRGELEITDAIWALHKATGRVRAIRLEGWWKDTGQPTDLIEANERVLASRPKSFFAVQGEIDPQANVSGHIALGAGSVIAAGATIRGPAVLGRKVRVESGAYIGPYTSIGDGSVIRRAEIDHSILMENVTVDIPGRIVDSIIGRGSQISERTHHPKGHSFILGDSTQVVL
ncbi:MAG: glucose-1-phosphate thymidylyltransferase [Candidatus Thermoplasmatota archaeon]|nr:glucose-1-phosphate thymidylyltransferase [Candidatus Thermoplasmatota archaeon]MCL5984733.1 glucose-1-phosphate thymidylyltransferase [Candidatus Thermoplasmatota archaeon]